MKSIATGVVFAASEVTIAEIRDGTSNTYMVGEKYLMPDGYHTGDGGADNESLYIGDNEDISKWSNEVPWNTGAGGYVAPKQDQPGFWSKRRFGSAHPGGWNVVLCDGSVRSISYSVAPDVHCRLCNRKDGQPIDASQF